MKRARHVNEADELIGQFAFDDKDWVRTFHAALVWHDAAPQAICAELRRILAATADSGQPAAQIFPDPAEYGLARARQLRSGAELARNEMPVDSLRSLLNGFGLTVGLLVFGFGLYIGLRDGWLAQSWQVLQLVCLVAGTGIAVAAHGWWYLRLSSRLKASWTMLLGGLTVSLGAAAALYWLLGDEFLPVPNLFAPVLGVLMIVGVFLLPYPAPDADGAPPAEGGPWFAAASRFLRGRYGFTGREAKQALAVARSHWAQVRTERPDADPNEEFGTPAEFAVGLAGESDGPVRRRWWLKQGLYLFVLACFGVGRVTGLVEEGPSGWNITMLVLWVLLLGLVLFGLRPAAREPEIAAKLAQRRKDAQAISFGGDDD